MKYVYTFSEINYGQIIIESRHEPNKDEVIGKILDGGADYGDTDIIDFRLVDYSEKTMLTNNESVCSIMRV